MNPEPTELLVNLNLLPEPSETFIGQHIEHFAEPLPSELCSAQYMNRTHVVGILLRKHTPARILTEHHLTQRPFARFGVTSEGIVCIRFKADWPARNSCLIGFTDSTERPDINVFLNDKKRMLCYLAKGATSDTFFHTSDAKTADVSAKEFVTFAEAFLSNIVALLMDTTEPAPGTVLSGIGDMSWLSLLMQHGVQIRERQEPSL